MQISWHIEQLQVDKPRKIHGSQIVVHKCHVVVRREFLKDFELECETIKTML